MGCRTLEVAEVKGLQDSGGIGQWRLQSWGAGLWRLQEIRGKVQGSGDCRVGVHNSGGCRDAAQDQVQIRWTEEQTERNFSSLH